MNAQDKMRALLALTFKSMQGLLEVKGGEYAGDVDPLANFRRNAEQIGVPMETIWRVYAGKHWDAVTQYVKDNQVGKTRPRSEPIEGRIDDIIVYLVLLKAILAERSPPPSGLGVIYDNHGPAAPMQRAIDLCTLCVSPGACVEQGKCLTGML